MPQVEPSQSTALQDQSPDQSPEEVQDPAQPPPEEDSPAAPEEEAGAPDPSDGEEPAEPGEGEEPKPPAQQPRKQPGGYQRKIARLEQERAILLEQLQRAGVAQPGAQPPPNETPEQKVAREAAERLDRLVDQRLAQREAEREQRAQLAKFQERTAAARAAHEDWDDAIASLDIPTHSPLGQALLTSEAGPEIMYQLATNPAELARLSALPPFAAAREIGRLEAKASGAGPQTPKPGLAKRPPPPPSSVGGSLAKPTRSLETLPISEYKRAYRSKAR